MFLVLFAYTMGDFSGMEDTTERATARWASGRLVQSHKPICLLHPSNKASGTGTVTGKGKLKGEEVEDMLRKIPCVPRGSTARRESGHLCGRLHKVEQDLAVLARHGLDAGVYIPRHAFSHH
jgi:hypothetical protein